MASGPITSQQIERGKMQTVTDFIFLDSKITVDGVWSHEIKRHLLHGREAMTNLGSGLKSRDITLLTKIHLVRAMVSPVVMYGCDNWTNKKAEHQRTDAFKLWCWRRLLRVLWTAGIKLVNAKGKQPWIFIGRTEAEALILWPSDAKSWLTEKDLEAGKDWGQGRSWRHRMRWVVWIINSVDTSLRQWDSEGQGSLACCTPWGCKEWDPTGWLNNNTSYTEGTHPLPFACLSQNISLWKVLKT